MIVMLETVTLISRREIGVWVLLLGRLQEAPPTKVCKNEDDDDGDDDGDDDDDDSDDDNGDIQAAVERAQQQGLTLTGLCSFAIS